MIRAILMPPLDTHGDKPGDFILTLKFIQDSAYEYATRDAERMTERDRTTI